MEFLNVCKSFLLPHHSISLCKDCKLNIETNNKNCSTLDLTFLFVSDQIPWSKVAATEAFTT